MKALGEALARLDPESRALLDLSLRRGMSDEEIAGVLRVERPEVAQRRADLVDRLADELDATSRDARDELIATLPDLPDVLWRG
jgi:DNA-directed RNA polymerase specialized sigma24 family protein